MSKCHDRVTTVQRKHGRDEYFLAGLHRISAQVETQFVKWGWQLKKELALPLIYGKQLLKPIHHNHVARQMNSNIPYPDQYVYPQVILEKSLPVI